jgi:hypothetical protein
VRVGQLRHHRRHTEASADSPIEYDVLLVCWHVEFCGLYACCARDALRAVLVGGVVCMLSMLSCVCEYSLARQGKAYGLYSKGKAYSKISSLRGTVRQAYKTEGT